MELLKCPTRKTKKTKITSLFINNINVYVRNLIWAQAISNQSISSSHHRSGTFFQRNVIIPLVWTIQCIALEYTRPTGPSPKSRDQPTPNRLHLRPRPLQDRLPPPLGPTTWAARPLPSLRHIPTKASPIRAGQYRNSARSSSSQG